MDPEVIEQEQTDGAEAEQQVDQVVEQAEGGDQHDGADTDTGTGTAEAPIEVTIGDEKPEEEEKAPSWVKELRVKNRTLERENRELKRQQTPAAQALGKKPELADFEYDTAQYEPAYAAWVEKTRVADEAQAWRGKLADYGVAKAALKVPDFDEAEASAREFLSEPQQASIVTYAKNPALVVLALGKNPKKAQELGAITDLGQFIYAIANLETQLKVTKKATPPPPEKAVTGTGSLSGASDSTLDRLRADAAKTGDYSKVVAHKRSKRA
jgi:hypothetical protein